MGAITTTINSVSVSVYEGSFELDDSINNPSTIMFRVRDDLGTSHYTKGQPVSITDSVSGLQFTGFVTAAIEDRVSPQTLIKTDISGRDNTYLAQKRTYDGPEFTNVPAGVILCALLNVLSSEGVTAQYASDRDTTATDFNAGTLSGVVGASNLGDGDLELTLAGSPVTKTETTTSDFNAGTLTNVVGVNNALQLTSHTCIKATAYSNGYQGNSYCYIQIWAGDYVIASGDFLQFYMWVASSSPSIQVSIDGVCSDNSSIRDFNSGSSFIVDDDGLRAHPNIDLSGYANDQWHFRHINLSPLAGKHLKSITIGFEGDSKGQYTAYFHDILIMNGASTNLTIFTSTLNTKGYVVGRFGYSTLAAQTSVSVVTAYDQSGSRISTTTSLTGVGVFKNGTQSWSVLTLPSGTSLIMSTSFDGGITWQQQTNLAPLQGILAGASASGINLLTKQELTITGPDPTLTPIVDSVVTTINPSYTATKTDVVYTKSTTTDFSAGTLTNTLAQLSNAGLTLNGFWKNWDDELFSNMDGFSTGTTIIGTTQRHWFMQVTTGTDVRARFTDASTWQILDMSCDVQLPPTNANIGLEYGTTNWGNNNNSFAYAISLDTGKIELGKGTNSVGAGGYTALTTFTFPTALTAGDWHQLRVVWNGSTHTHNIYLDGTLYLTSSDATWTATGYVAMRLFNGTGSTLIGNFDNFSIVKTYTSTTWLSPNYSLNSVGTCGDSFLFWNATIPALSSLLVETTINGGSTWQTATNGAQIPGLSSGVALAGVNLQIRVTFTEGIGQETIFKGFTAWVMSQYSSSGNRISPALSLATITVRLGSSIVAWNSVLASGCTLGVDTRIDSGSWTDQTAQNGLAVTGLNGQPSPTFDSFDANTSASYTNTAKAGGSASTWTYDTANSRIAASGGSGGLFIRSLP